MPYIVREKITDITEMIKVNIQYWLSTYVPDTV